MNTELLKTPFELMNTREDFIRNFIDSLAAMPASVMLSYWENYIASNLIDSYKKEVQFLIDHNIVPVKISKGEVFGVGDLREVHSNNLNYIKKLELADIQKKSLLSCYNAFCQWLHEISFGWFSARGITKQNFEPTPFELWRMFVETLYSINKRDELIARALLQGQKRVSTMLRLKLEQVNFEDHSITFVSKGKPEKIIYHKYFMDDLQAYINATQQIRKEPYVFVTRTGSPVTRARLNYSFEQVGKILPSIKNKITPDTLRCLWLQLQRDGYNEGIIMRSKQVRVDEDMRLQKEFLNNLEVSL